MKLTEDPRLVGRIIKIRGFQVIVGLLEELNSPIRATLDGVHTALSINGYLTFSIGPNRTIVGVITELESKDSSRARNTDRHPRFAQHHSTAVVQLLGTLSYEAEEISFTPAVTVLPTLGTVARIGSPHLLHAMFATPRSCNHPAGGRSDSEFDYPLQIGTINSEYPIRFSGSYNDLLSRPLAVLGNTGSGKSFTIASLVQKAVSVLEEDEKDTHIFILDINGEYSSAFNGQSSSSDLQPDVIYLNGDRFGIPVWLFNSEEVCSWLNASEQTQAPLLKDWWSIEKSGDRQERQQAGVFQNALRVVDQFLNDLTAIKRKEVGSRVQAIESYLRNEGIDLAELKACTKPHMKIDKFNTEILHNQGEIHGVLHRLRSVIDQKIVGLHRKDHFNAESADAPLYIPCNRLIAPSLTDNVVSQEDFVRVDQHLATLRVRLTARLNDRRWSSFLNYEEDETRFSNIGDWIKGLGIGTKTHKMVSILDLSMLSHEILPYACAVVGRILLEARECLDASMRYKCPWVIVLEEAHNYAKPRRINEDSGQSLSRKTFERVAKEGRKFGLSIVVASQRPSEVSHTIVSQCANFLCHRLQNPDDIEHIRRIIPIQAAGLLDQITSLQAGEAIAFGSAFQVPARAVIDLPRDSPSSYTAAPYYEWRSRDGLFPLQTLDRFHRMNEVPDSRGKSSDADDDIPF